MPIKDTNKGAKKQIYLTFSEREYTKKAAQSFTDERLTLLQLRIIQRELLLLQVLLSQEPQQVPQQPSLKNDVYA